MSTAEPPNLAALAENAAVNGQERKEQTQVEEVHDWWHVLDGDEDGDVENEDGAERENAESVFD